MLRYTLLLGLVLSTATPAWAGGDSWAHRMFEGELEWNFGAVPHGQMLLHYFRIVNNTNTTVRVSAAVPSCGRCTTATVMGNLLAPGQEAFVRVQLDSRVFSGHKDVTFDVYFDVPNNGSSTIEIARRQPQRSGLLPRSSQFREDRERHYAE